MSYLWAPLVLSILLGYRAGPEELVQGQDAFARALYARLASAEGNLFLSPYSVCIALAMTREGAKGNTAAQMDEVLHLPAAGAAESFRKLAEDLHAPDVSSVQDGKEEVRPAYALEIANALWAQHGFQYASAFEEILRTAYQAGFSTVDFAKPEKARATINDWVEEKTREKVKDLIPPGLLDAATRLVITNAIYFKASWMEPFRSQQTRDAPFTTQRGDEVQVPMMHSKQSLGYAEREGVQVLELPYAGGHLSMVILLPEEKDGLPRLEELVAARPLASWWKGLTTKMVDVKLPRFEYSSSFDLTRTLPAMGMKDAFDAGRADFSGITPQIPLYIGAVLHKAFVAVDEQGTEAAAATAVVMRLGAAVGEAVEFTADHPFLFLIRHRATGSVLFMGRVADPTRS
ncbi:MAG: serpin family protein [Planctomycetota bacterium]